MNPCADTYKYADGWREYRRLRRNLVLVWLGYVPVVGVLAEVGFWLFGSFVPGFICAGAYCLVFIFSFVQWGQFSCPRCGESFASRGFVHLGPFARKCMHCDLRKWQCDDIG
jgi:hypothetical protein